LGTAKQPFLDHCDSNWDVVGENMVGKNWLGRTRTARLATTIPL